MLTRITIRAIAAPFVLGIILISSLISSIRTFFFFLKHGGEFIFYQKNEQARISDIYTLLKKLKYDN